MTIQSALKKLQKLMRLQDWDITIVESNATQSAQGRNYILFNDYKCEILLDIDLSNEVKMQTLIHEMLHLIFRDCNDIASDNIENEKLNTIYSRTHERAIEQTAKILYDLVERNVQ